MAIVLFSAVAYYFYQKWNMPRADKYKDIYQPNDNGANEAVIYFFFADWCPHCTNAKPEWTSFANKHDGKLVNGELLMYRNPRILPIHYCPFTIAHSPLPIHHCPFTSLLFVIKFHWIGFLIIFIVTHKKIKVDYSAKSHHPRLQ